jgi:hypothetical protein
MILLNYTISCVLIFLMIIQLILLIILSLKLSTIELFITSGTKFFIDADNVIPKFDRFVNILDRFVLE